MKLGSGRLALSATVAGAGTSATLGQGTPPCAQFIGGCGGVQVATVHAPLPSAQAAAAARKNAAQLEWLRAHPEATGGPRSAQPSPYYQSGNWFYSNNYLSKPEPDPYDSYGSSVGGGWIFNATHTSISCCHNPRNDNNFYYDLCGPGSSTFTVHTWQPANVNNYSNSTGDGEGLSYNGVYGWGTGWYGFLYYAAYNEMQYNGGTNGLWWESLDTTQRTFLNNNEGVVTFEIDPYVEVLRGARACVRGWWDTRSLARPCRDRWAKLARAGHGHRQAMARGPARRHSGGDGG